MTHLEVEVFDFGTTTVYFWPRLEALRLPVLKGQQQTLQGTRS
jgi:hypothetical protein